MDFWPRCSERLEVELSAQQFNTWIRPLQVIENENQLKLLAPNRFVLDWVRNHYLTPIQKHMEEISGDARISVTIEIGSKKKRKVQQTTGPISQKPAASGNDERIILESNLNPNFTFESFVEGKSNQIARAASIQISENPGKAYNPLFIYGGVG
ncbi:MAG: DnaA N-terminal domain-containing protein, partial [Chromatiales bacterium]